jgi:hypothetical protein
LGRGQRIFVARPAFAFLPLPVRLLIIAMNHTGSFARCHVFSYEFCEMIEFCSFKVNGLCFDAAMAYKNARKADRFGLLK